MHLTQELLKTEIVYDQLTGVFTRARDTKVSKAGDVIGKPSKNRGTVRIRIGSNIYKGHRLAWLYITGSWPVDDIDHKDRDPSNNKFDNLRDVSRSVNCVNKAMSLTNTTGVTGVTQFKGRFRVQGKINGNVTSLGVYNTIQEAKIVRERWETDVRGY